MSRIFPRNLTARAAYQVPGNPPGTRPESGVANCYPGLEYDHRNLDRRFFPGLVIEYVSQEDAADPSAARQGGRVVDTDTADVALTDPPPGFEATATALAMAVSGMTLSDDNPVFLLRIEQDGREIALEDDLGVPLDGLVVWRLVRSLRPGPVTVVIGSRGSGDDVKPPVVLTGWRRRYTDPATGVIDLTFQPGELSQSLCSPWMHDFRDCACTYWASNHPDIVFAEAAPGSTPLPSGQPDDPAAALTRVDWLRDRPEWALTAEAAPRQQDNAQYQMSHYQINETWEDLAIVLEGREIGGVYFARSASADQAEPFPDGEALLAEITRLAGLEHAVMLMYLYAMFSVVDSNEAAAVPGAPSSLAGDAAAARHILLEVAVGEMQHLRWVNQLLWALSRHLGREYQPVVAPPSLVLPAVPPAHAGTPVTLASLDLPTLATFVEIERPSAYIDGQYARVTSTLRDPSYPPMLHQLASNIAQDGENHFLEFRDLQRVLGFYEGTPFLRAIRPGDPAAADVAAALGLYRRILDLLAEGYHFDDPQQQTALGQARTTMLELQSAAETLAAAGVGIPFLAPWQPPAPG